MTQNDESKYVRVRRKSFWLNFFLRDLCNIKWRLEMKGNLKTLPEIKRIGSSTRFTLQIYAKRAQKNVKVRLCAKKNTFRLKFWMCYLKLNYISVCYIWKVILWLYRISKASAEVFYYVNYANVNYSVKNLTVDCKYLLYFLWVSSCFFKQTAILAFSCTVLVLI